MTNQLERLNSFLRGEIAAVETHRQAIEAMAGIAGRSQLEQCCESHQRRVDLLRRRIIQLGGRPAKSSGAWGALAKLAEGGAAMLGHMTALGVLEEGEDRGLKEYKTHLADLDTDSRLFVEQELLPAQVQTHFSVATLKHALH